MNRVLPILFIVLLSGCSAGIASAPPDDVEIEDLRADDPAHDPLEEDPGDTIPETVDTEGHDHDAVEDIGEEEEPECPEGTIWCGEDCVDTRSDRNHCGSCSTICGEEEFCRNGLCICPPKLTSCGGHCVDTDAEHGYCGDCGRSCSEEAVCSEGSCRFECEEELAECETGSCYNLDSSVDHCGSCEISCERGSEVCIEGTCRSYTTPGPSCWHCPCGDCSEAELLCCIIDVLSPPLCLDVDWCP